MKGGATQATDAVSSGTVWPSLVSRLSSAWRERTYGLAAVGAGTLAAAYVSERTGAPLTLVALLFGLALNFLSEDRRLEPGIRFVTGPALKLGIVLLGARVSLLQIAALGPAALASIVAIALATIVSAIFLSSLLGRSRSFGLLSGGAVAICGASAALALAEALGNSRAPRSELARLLICIAIVSAAAMLFYPMLAGILGLSDRQAGFVLGAAIHDVAQALGAGYTFSHPAGDVATIVKLSRVALLVPILIAVRARLPREAGPTRLAAFPWFVLIFFTVSAFATFVPLPGAITATSQFLSSTLLAAAVTATGIRAPLASLREDGWGIPLVLVLSASAVALALSLWAAVTLLP